jgi:hypothetical protein
MASPLLPLYSPCPRFAAIRVRHATASYATRILTGFHRKDGHVQVRSQSFTLFGRCLLVDRMPARGLQISESSDTFSSPPDSLKASMPYVYKILFSEIKQWSAARIFAAVYLQRITTHGTYKTWPCASFARERTSLHLKAHTAICCVCSLWYPHCTDLDTLARTADHGGSLDDALKAASRTFPAQSAKNVATVILIRHQRDLLALGHSEPTQNKHTEQTHGPSAALMMMNFSALVSIRTPCRLWTAVAAAAIAGLSANAAAQGTALVHACTRTSHAAAVLQRRKYLNALERSCEHTYAAPTIAWRDKRCNHCRKFLHPSNGAPPWWLYVRGDLPTH